MEPVIPINQCSNSYSTSIANCNFKCITIDQFVTRETTTFTATPSASTGGILTTIWFLNGTGVTNAGNTRLVNVEQVGRLPGNHTGNFSQAAVCSNQSSVVLITQHQVRNSSFSRARMTEGLPFLIIMMEVAAPRNDCYF